MPFAELTAAALGQNVRGQDSQDRPRNFREDQCGGGRYARGTEQSYFVAAEGMRDFNVRLIEMAYANTVAALDLAREISTAKGPSEATALWSSHAQKQFERLTERELTVLAQRIATSSAEPIARSFGQALHRPD